MYKTGDKFIVEIDRCIATEDCDSGIKDVVYGFKEIDNFCLTAEEIDKMIPFNSDAAYIRGLNDAWDTARIIGGIGEDVIPCKDLQRLFGVDSPCYIFRDVWAFDAMQTVRKYVEKTRDEIKVGDEVLFPLVGEPFKAVVMDETDEDGVWYIYSENGCVERMAERLFKRTGRHFPQIAEVLKQMQEDE